MGIGIALLPGLLHLLGGELHVVLQRRLALLVSHEHLDGTDVDFSVREVRTESLPQNRGVVGRGGAEEGVVGHEDRLDGSPSHRISDPVAEEGDARQRFSHLRVAVENLLEEGMGEEREPFTDGEPAGSLASDADRALMEVNVGDLDAAKLRSAQAASDTEGEDAQIPAMDEQGELMGFSESEQLLVVAADAAQQPHELKRRRERADRLLVFDLNAELFHGVGSDESSQLHRAEESPEHNLDDLEGEPLVVPGLLEVREVSANAGGVHGGDAQPGMALLQPPREEAQMAEVVTNALVRESPVLQMIRDEDAQALIDIRRFEGSTICSATNPPNGLDDLLFPQRRLAP